MTSPDAHPLIVERHGATAKFILNRPNRKNALNNQMLAELAAALQDAIADDAVRTIVVTGAGACFSSGRDIKEFGAPVKLEDQSLDASTGHFMQVLSSLLDAPKPTIAAVCGFALGGGQAMTLACDFVVVERDAKFGNVEMAYGFPAAMNIVLLAQHLGRRLGLEIAMSGELYSAERYWEMGLVNRLVEPGSIDAGTEAFTEMLNSRAPWSVQRTKTMFRMAEEMPAKGGLYLGNQLNQMLRLASQSSTIHSQSNDVKDALKSTIEPDVHL